MQTPSLKAIVKFREHLRIKATNYYFANHFPNFLPLKKYVSNEINKFNSCKVIQDTERKQRFAFDYTCLFFKQYDI